MTFAKRLDCFPNWLSARGSPESIKRFAKFIDLSMWWKKWVRLCIITYCTLLISSDLKSLVLKRYFDFTYSYWVFVHSKVKYCICHTDSPGSALSASIFKPARNLLAFGRFRFPVKNFASFLKLKISLTNWLAFCKKI